MIVDLDLPPVLVGGGEEGEDVTLLHRHLSRALLRVVLQRHHALPPTRTCHRRLLVLQTSSRRNLNPIHNGLSAHCGAYAM